MRISLAALLGLTLLRLVMAAILPLTPDEAYYYSWARHLQAGYLDHPPMVALWISAGTALFGQDAFGVRVLGPVSAAIGSWFMYDAGNRLLPDRRIGLWAAALFNATLMLGAGCVLMTPDIPLLFFWALGIWALARLIQAKTPYWWLVAGGCAGLMLFSKYTAVLFLAGTGLWALTCAPIRQHLRTVWPWLGIALAGLIFAPDIAWNAAHGWASYLKQGGRVNGFDLARSAQFLGELLGAQTLLLTPLIAALAVAGLWRLRGDKAPGARLLLWLTLLPALVFLEHVLTNRVESNWPAVLYPSACLAAASLASRWQRPALLLGFGMTALVYAQCLTGFIPLAADRDTTALQLVGWPALARQAAAANPAFLTADDYGLAAELAFYAPKNVPVLGFSKRWRYFDWPAAHVKGQSGLRLIRQGHAPCPNPVVTLARRRGAQTIAVYQLCRMTAPPGGKVIPRP